MKKMYFLCIVAFLGFLLGACSRNDEGIVSKSFLNPRGLDEFNMYEDRDIDYKFYVSQDSIDSDKLSDGIKSNVDLNVFKDIGYKETKKKSLLFLADSESEDKRQHVQLQYFFNDNCFLIFTAYECNDINIELLKKDSFGNKMIVEGKGDTKTVLKKQTTKGSITYNYYLYDEQNKEVNTVSTVADEIMMFKDGILYQVASTCNIDKEELREYILRFAKSY